MNILDGANGAGNRKGIGIEICYSKSGGDRFIKAEKLSAEFIAQLLKERGWGLDKVKKHQDFDTHKKYCPHRTLDMGWQRFLNMIDGYLNPSKPAEPKPEQQTVKPVVGAIVYFSGNKHYITANSGTGYVAKPGNAKITNFSEGAAHPYHIVHTDNKSNVYGWVNAADIGAANVEKPTPAPKPVVTEIEKGDIVYFTGGKHYVSANSNLGYKAKAGKAKITNIKKGAKHEYHAVRVSGGGSNVYGWVDASTITK